MGEEEKRLRLQALQQEVVAAGQIVYGLQQEFENRLQDIVQYLEWLSSEIQRESSAEEEYRYLQYRVDRYRDFGEPLP
jgi:hypothetical protein